MSVIPEQIMIKKGTFRLKGPNLLSLGRGADNPHRLAMQSGVSTQTIYRYFNDPESVKQVDLVTLASIIIDGLGISPEDLHLLSFADVFEFIPNKENGTE
jgi:hypothetical protein